jgi:hypothetical protein
MKKKKSMKLKVFANSNAMKLLDTETRGIVPRYRARLHYIAWICMERVFFNLTVWPSKIEMKKHALHASPGDVAWASDDAA